MCYCPIPTLYLNLALTGDCAFQLSPQKTHSVWFISVLKSGDMGQCPEKSPSPCNTCVISVSLYKSMSWFVTKTRAHTHTRACTLVIIVFVWLPQVNVFTVSKRSSYRSKIFFSPLNCSGADWWPGHCLGVIKVFSVVSRWLIACQSQKNPCTPNYVLYSVVTLL